MKISFDPAKSERNEIERGARVFVSVGVPLSL